MGKTITFQQQLFNRLASDKRFLAYFLNLHLQMEGEDLNDLAVLLKSPISAIFKLGSCQAPSHKKLDFNTRINAIATYAEVDAPALAKLVKRIGILDGLRESGPQASQGSILMAARDKDTEEE